VALHPLELRGIAAQLDRHLLQLRLEAGLGVLTLLGTQHALRRQHRHEPAAKQPRKLGATHQRAGALEPVPLREVAALLDELVVAAVEDQEIRVELDHALEDEPHAVGRVGVRAHVEYLDAPFRVSVAERRRQVLGVDLRGGVGPAGARRGTQTEDAEGPGLLLHGDPDGSAPVGLGMDDLVDLDAVHPLALEEGGLADQQHFRVVDLDALHEEARRQLEAQQQQYGREQRGRPEHRSASPARRMLRRVRLRGGGGHLGVGALLVGTGRL
jgi:hypothetical protein